MRDKTASYDDLRKMCTPDKLGIAGFVNPPRVGSRKFITLLEHRHFSPRNAELNKQFEMALLQYQDIHLFLVLIPMAKRALADQLCQELRLRLADGTPHILGGEGLEWKFPVDGPNVFTLENQSGSFVYMNNQKLYQAALEAEQDAVDKIFENFERGLPI